MFINFHLENLAFHLDNLAFHLENLAFHLEKLAFHLEDLAFPLENLATKRSTKNLGWWWIQCFVTHQLVKVGIFFSKDARFQAILATWENTE